MRVPAGVHAAAGILLLKRGAAHISVKSILDVEVQTQSFERFSQLFDKYSDGLRKQPEIWKKINEQHERLATGFAAFGSKLDEHFSTVHDIKDEQEANEKSLERSSSLWGNIEKSSASTAKSVIGTTASLLKWTGLFSGVTGLLSYLTLDGMMNLGHGVFGMQKSSLGLGVGIGQQRAFDIAFGRLLGSPEGFLSGINSATSNIASPGYAMLNALGVNPNGSNSQVAISTLEALRTRAQSTPINQLGILEQMYQLGNLGISLEDLRRLKSMSGGKFNHLLGTYQTQQSILNINGRTADAWTDFTMKMELAGAKIENVFVKDLVSLSGPLSNLTTSFADLLSKIGQKNGPLAQGIDSIASWIDSFNGVIKTPEFLKNLQSFVDDLAKLFDPNWGPAKFLNDLVGVPTGPAKTAATSNSPSWWTSGAAVGGYLRDKYESWKWTNTANMLDPSGLLAAVGAIESGMNPYAPNSPKGAEGMMQIMPSAARAAGINPYDPEQSLTWAKADLDRLMRDYHGDIGKTLAAYNWGEGNLNRDIGRYGNLWAAHLPDETLKYVLRGLRQMNIKVEVVGAPPGFSATAAVSGLGAQP